MYEYMYMYMYMYIYTYTYIYIVRGTIAHRALTPIRDGS